MQQSRACSGGWTTLSAGIAETLRRIQLPRLPVSGKGICPQTRDSTRGGKERPVSALWRQNCLDTCTNPPLHSLVPVIELILMFSILYSKHDRFSPALTSQLHRCELLCSSVADRCTLLPTLLVDRAGENRVEGWVNFLADVLDNESLSTDDGSFDIS